MLREDNRIPYLALICLLGAAGWTVGQPKTDPAAQATAGMKKAAEYYHGTVASHGGYVYHYTLDLKQRWGEGPATVNQIWVQPPATPTVGIAFLKAYEATGDRFYLNAAEDTAKALLYGQLKSGAWTNAVDFDPKGSQINQYRNGKGGGKNKNFSTLDDGISQTAIRFLVRADKAFGFKHKEIHDGVQIALEALLNAQFPNGAFPQGWDGDKAARPPIVKASYPRYDWRTEGRVDNYWDMYTLNDDLCGYLSVTLIEAYETYQDDRYLRSLVRLGDFLVLAQMPNPQPAWAQQYSYEMHPIWARRFEPAGISGRESQDAMQTLLGIYRQSGDEKYLEPIPKAIGYLKKSLLPDGRLARYYELETNKPLYMTRQGRDYTLTHDDSKLPDHYGWKTDSRLEAIEREYRELKRSGPRAGKPAFDISDQQARQVIADLDSQGRWITVYTGQPLVGQPKFRANEQILSSAVFAANMELLSAYLISKK